MALTTFLRFGSRRPKATTDAFDILGDLVPWQESVDANAAKVSSLGFRNHIRNGDMGIRQRGNGAFTAVNVYTADGWIKGHVGGTHSVSVADLPAASMGSRGYLASTVAGQAAAGDQAVLTQAIEGVRTFSGQQVTLSFVASTPTAGTKVGVEVVQQFGTGGTPSADVNTAVSAITISTTETRYTVTFTVPSIAGKILGTSGTDNLRLYLWLSAGTTFAARASNIGIQNATHNVWDVQLEAGPDAAPFERLPLSEQLVWAQRYFQRLTVAVTGYATSATAARFGINYATVMRTAPTVALQAAGLVNHTGGNPVPSALTANSTYAGSLYFDLAVTGLTAGQGLVANGVGLDLSAEL